MKKFKSFKFWIIFFSFFVFYKNYSLFARILIDKIVARANGVNILKSDLQTPQMSKEGQFLSLNEAVKQELLVQKAAEKKLLPTGIDIERQIVAIKIQNKMENISDKEFEGQLKQEGFTLKEYKRQLARMLSIEKLRQLEFSEKVVVTTSEIEAYYKKNPIKAQAIYTLELCDLDKNNVSSDGNLVKSFDTNKIKWESLGDIKKNELSKSLQFVSTMSSGEISKPLKTSSGYQLIRISKINPEHLMILDERRFDIERTIQEEKKKKFEKEFEKELLEKSSVVYLD